MSKLFLFKNLKHLIISRARTRAFVTLVSSHTHQPFSSSSVEPVQDSSSRNSFAIDYLIKSCGLPPKRAVLASKFVKFKVADKPDAALAFFKDHGFTDTQISKVVNCSPQLLVSSPENTLLPKLEFFKSKGFSESDVAVIIAECPQILMRSLENQLVPSFNYFSELLLSSARKSITALKRCAGVLLLDLDKHRVDNIEILKKNGVPLRKIEYMLANRPAAFMTNCDKFRQIVDDVTKIGFDPLNIKFMIAVLAFRSMSKTTWARKVEVYKHWGWSEDDVIAAFRKVPWCMFKTEDKINSVMDLWVNKMGWKSSLLVIRPDVLTYSLEKRVAPRLEVYQFLVSNSLLNPADTSFASTLNYPENRFLERFIDPHKEQAPDLLKLYKQKLDLAN